MITDLNIENFAIIDRLGISFEEGLNIITGETGAGKSIVVDAANLLLGERADKSLVRYGSERARVEAVFQTDGDKKIAEALEQYGIDREDDGVLLVTREVYSNGRSVARINGRIVTLTMLKDIVPKLLDIQSQNENQKLLRPENQLEVVDALCGKPAYSLREAIRTKYYELKELEVEIGRLSGDEMEKERKVDLLKFQIDEIDEAALKSGEEDELMTEYKKLSANEDIKGSVEKAVSEISEGAGNSQSILERLYGIHSSFAKVGSYDEKLERFSEETLNTYYQLQELNRDIVDYSLSLETSGVSIEDVGKRLDQINGLKRKYGNTVEEITAYRDKIDGELSLLENLEEELGKLSSRRNEILSELGVLSSELSEIRLARASTFEEKMVSELKELNMGESIFEVSITDRGEFSETGKDRVEFRISTNPGQPIGPISKVVSGGELSRIMLAFKNILAEQDDIATLIFDEIDTGISGRTAQLVGEKIGGVARMHQIICITHLPQIAAMANTHFRITKETDGDLTTARIEKLEYEEKVDEITRLIGGVSLTDTSRKHAAEMLELSSSLK